MSSITLSRISRPHLMRNGRCEEGPRCSAVYRGLPKPLGSRDTRLEADQIFCDSTATHAWAGRSNRCRQPCSRITEGHDGLAVPHRTVQLLAPQPPLFLVAPDSVGVCKRAAPACQRSSFAASLHVEALARAGWPALTDMAETLGQGVELLWREGRP